MNPDNCALAAQGLVSLSYIRQGEQGLARRQRLVKSLLSSRRLPEAGWDEATIEMFIRVRERAAAARAGEGLGVWHGGLGALRRLE